MIPRFVMLLPLALAMIASTCARGQTPLSSVPTEPLGLMNVAHEKNGLAGEGIQPWHIRGTYHTYSQNGKPEFEGTYEEWWVGHTRYKRTFSTPQFTQTDYATGTALLREGAQEWPKGPELLLRESLIDPLPESALLSKFQLRERQESAGKATLNCVSMLYPVRPNLAVGGEFFPRACFDPSIPALRMYSVGSAQKLFYGHIVSFKGHYIAEQLQFYFAGKLAADLNIEVIETLKGSPDNAIAPSGNVVPVDLDNIMIDEVGRSHWPQLLRSAVPVYPADAKSMRAQGTVNIEAIIGEDGHLKNAKILDGNPFLRQASLDAVNQWLYRPFEVMGKPRTVKVRLHVIFQMA